MERYSGVRGHARAKFIENAIEASGGSIIERADPTCAPFEYTVRTVNGERLNIVCYAFTANKYQQAGRPTDEHRFQVKYGSDFTRPHKLFVDPKQSKTTLMFGVHEELGLFVAVDPTMHNPTWFSSSVEFKEAELKKAKKTGWHGWERERMQHGRRKISPTKNSDTRTEVVFAFSPENFLTYALFEREAQGMDPGERLLLIDKMEERYALGKSGADLLVGQKALVAPAESSELLQQLGLTSDELLEMLGSRFRLLAAVRGGVAEHHLEKQLKASRFLENVTRPDADGQPDFQIQFRNHLIRIECKNVLRTKVKGNPRVDFQKTRASKGDPCSRYYSPEQFEILAACLHPVTEKWEFQFAPTSTLPPHNTCIGRLSTNVNVVGKNWTHNLMDTLEYVLSENRNTRR